jgi:hypothetical protein
VNQPLYAAIETGLGNIFASTPLAILQPRTAIAYQISPHTVLRTGFGLFSDLLPGSIADLTGVNPPYSQTFVGGLLGTVGGTAIGPGVPGSAVDATAVANQIFSTGFASGQLSCASPLSNPNTCLQPVPVGLPPAIPHPALPRLYGRRALSALRPRARSFNRLDTFEKVQVESMRWGR